MVESSIRMVKATISSTSVMPRCRARLIGSTYCTVTTADGAVAADRLLL